MAQSSGVAFSSPNNRSIVLRENSKESHCVTSCLKKKKNDIGICDAGKPRPIPSCKLLPSKFTLGSKYISYPLQNPCEFGPDFACILHSYDLSSGLAISFLFPHFFFFKDGDICSLIFHLVRS